MKTDKHTKDDFPFIEIWTDGACRGNPGRGGWGAVFRSKDHEWYVCGGTAHTTNNRMELMAVICALESLKQPSRVRIITDSQYVMKGGKELLSRWKQRGWRTANRKPVKNKDLWEILDILCNYHRIEWVWVRGHRGHERNELADCLANRGIDQMSIKPCSSGQEGCQ